MPEQKLLLCTDMDRTIIPNGFQPEPADARKQFNAFCNRPDVKLVYVTGRHVTLVKQAIKNYALPMPDYAITDVGTKIYQIGKGSWQQMVEWEAEIDQDWHGKTHAQLKQLLKPISELRLQESSKQNTHKLSYYLPLYLDKDSIFARIEACLSDAGVEVSVLWSIDEPKNVGLLDVLPKHATKLHAIEFLQKKLDYALNEVIFAGDSGNDLPVLTSRIQSVLVDNASAEIKQAAVDISRHKGHASALYLAKSDEQDINGNYSAGVLQGVAHFAPHFCHSHTAEESS
ncbi:HAD-IIB family hydrolase [Methylophaga sp. OBS4]|uniref:HAD-IIB family hydrolase n=1 Tax=Methylophaga sp. OBS4 TaxID=2991935 RepID=UPI00224E0F99|nr:HAD-IIB family hydrolase [Methylophaga sp. OBS4]MCX4187059.1 HAD-IIB family hydrolase [Methylophaga sp. OBS4]